MVSVIDCEIRLSHKQHILFYKVSVVMLKHFGHISGLCQRGLKWAVSMLQPSVAGYAIKSDLKLIFMVSRSLNREILAALSTLWTLDIANTPEEHPCTILLDRMKSFHATAISQVPLTCKRLKRKRKRRKQRLASKSWNLWINFCEAKLIPFLTSRIFY